MAKKVVVKFKNPLNESRLDHLEVWSSLDGTSYSKVGSDIAFITGSADYVVDDASGYVEDGTKIWYQARAYNDTGNFDLVGGTITIGGSPFPLDEFGGYSRTNVTSITQGTIAKNASTGTAPFALMASASNVSATGSRTLTSRAFNPYEHLEHSFSITFDDGSPIPYQNELIDHKSGVPFNPYVNYKVNEPAFLLREPGSYLLTITSRGKTASGYITESKTETITVAENTSLTHEFYDAVLGRDSNDGNDPWGFLLTAGVYTEATGSLVQAGKFASYDHTAATAGYNTDQYNYIYVDGAARRIASKVSNNEIILLDKLGSDKTGLTSSNGPKQTFSALGANKHVHLKGGSSYNRSGSLDMYGALNVSKLLSSYAGIATLTKTTTSDPAPSSEPAIITNSINMSGHMASNIFVSNVILDGQGTTGVINSTHGSTVDTDISAITYDRIQTKDSRNENGVRYGGTKSTKPIHHAIWGGSIKNLKVASEPKRMAIYSSFDSVDCWERITGTIIDNTADSASLDHFIYPDGVHNNLGIDRVYFRGGSNNNYCLNINATASRQFVSVTNCLSDGNSNWLVDFGNSDNSPNVKTFTNVVVTGNWTKTDNALAYYSCAKSAFFKNNRNYSPSATHPLVNLAIQAGKEGVFVKGDFESVLEGNFNYGEGIVISSLGTNIELSSNICYQTYASRNTIKITKNNLGTGVEVAAIDNIVYAPDDADNLHLSVGATNISLREFNTAMGNLNKIGNPGFTSPSTLDFSRVAATPVLSAIPNVTQEQGFVYSADLTSYQTGGTVADTWSIVGTAPTGLTVNNSGWLNGTLSAAETKTIKVKAENAAGEVSSNDIVFTISAATVPVFSTIADIYVVTGSAYSFDFSTLKTSGSAVVSWGFSGGIKPTGASISSSGVMTIASATAETVNMAITATNSAGTTTTNTFEFKVGAFIAKVLTLDPVNKTYLSIPYIDLPVGSTVKFKLAGITRSISQTIIHTTVGNAPEVNINTLNKLAINSTYVSGVTINGTAVANGDALDSYLDGTFYQWVVTIKGTGPSISLIGKTKSNANYGAFSIKELEVDNLTVVRTWAIAGGQLNGETEASSPTGKTMTYNQTEAKDWT